LLWICSIVWSWVLWYLQHCSFCLIWSWLFVVFCVSKWTLGLLFNLCDECHCNFDGDCLKHIDCLWSYGHFSATDSMNPRIWKIFPSSIIFFYFFLQCFIVVIVEAFTFFSLFLSIFFEAIVHRIVLLISFSVYSLLAHRKAIGFCKWILYSATLLKVFMMSRRFFDGVFQIF
jgi:hypothetical protein